jgi:signal transduction histidine kinase
MTSFIASTLISEMASGSLQERARDISNGALPSIEHLSALRTELFRQMLLLEQHSHADTPSRPAIRRELLSTQVNARRWFDAYARLPSFPNERSETEVLRTRLDEADALITEALATATPEEEREELDHRVEPALERAESVAFGLMQLNAEEARQLSAEIEQAHARSVLAAYLLDALSALLSVAVAVLVWRTVRYYLEAQEAQQRLLGARADELEAFSGRVAHDILSPLSAVGLALGLLERGVAPEQAVPRARNSLKRVHRIVEALLTFARSGAKPAPDARCDVGPVLEGVLADAAPAAAEHEVKLELSGQTGLSAACDAGVLHSIAGNLVANAVKYLGEGGEERRVSLRASARGGMIYVEVEDTGPGIPPAIQRTIFEPYTRGKDLSKPGIGLGLATAKRLCEAHRGRIGLRSEEGRGSTFWFELPEASNEPAFTQPPDEASPPPLAH